MKRLPGLLLAVVAGAVAALVGSTPAVADPHDDQVRVARELARAQAALEVATDDVAAAVQSYDEASRQLPAVRQQAALARGVLADAKAHAAAAARESATAARGLATANRGLATASRQVDQAQSQIDQYAVRAYRTGTVAGISALLSVENPTEFVAGLTYLDRVAAQQQAALDAGTLAQAHQRDQRAVRADRARDATAAARAAADAVAQAKAAADRAGQAEAKVAALVARRDNAVRVAESHRAEILKRYQDLQAESARIEAQVKALAHGSARGPALRPGIRLPMPVTGWKSSDFGMRFDPYYHVWQLHAGVDLAAPAGTPIHAVAAGRVIRAGWAGGYGNYTCLYHGTYQGKGFATCYGHQSAILVKVGQQVTRGQVIGRVGSTGAATGNHLHFEVRLDGVPVNPLPWLPACLC